MPALWHGTEVLCGSAIMVPDGAIRARVYHEGLTMCPVDYVLTAGPDLLAWWEDDAELGRPSIAVLPFSSAMRERLSRLSVCVIGVSGTGSVVAEQLARLGVGEIILIDYDKLEERNLNRILNSTTAELGRLKVEVFAEAVRRYRPDCDVIAVPSAVGERPAIEAACEADILFSCVDTAEGRHIADRLGAYFAMPLFDVGVVIPTEATRGGQRKISEVYGRIDYVFPGGSSLLDRGVYDAKALEAEYLARTAPNALALKISDGYLQGAAEQAPAVISVNMRAASACVIEFIARLFPFRQFPNGQHARSIFMLGEGDEDTYPESHFVAGGALPIAKGFAEPLLGLPALTKPRKVA
jgi:hypothetical protein